MIGEAEAARDDRLPVEKRLNGKFPNFLETVADLVVHSIMKTYDSVRNKHKTLNMRNASWYVMFFKEKYNDHKARKKLRRGKADHHAKNILAPPPIFFFPESAPAPHIKS